MVSLIRKHPELFAWGILTCYFTNIGQTFLLAFFTQVLENNLHFSRTALSACFSISTFSAAFFLPLLGRYFDRSSLFRVSMTFSLMSLVGYGILHQAKSLVMVCVAYFLIKSFSQGGLTISYTSMVSKYFGKNRGRALGLCNLSHPLAQATLPICMTFFMINYNWKASILFIMGALVFLYIIPIFFLMRKFKTKIPLYEENVLSKSAAPLANINALKDWRFYLVSLGNILPPLIMSGVFFQQDRILNSKHWDLAIFAKGMTFFSISQLFSNLLSGYLIDRFTARKILPFGILPLLVSYWILYTGESVWTCYLFFFTAGISAVMTGTIKNALWAEVYGIGSLGKIRGIDLQFNVFSTALGPTLFAFLMEWGMSIQEILKLFIILIVIGAVIHFISYHLYKIKESSPLAINT